jgi:hypothetical protein
MAFNKLFAVGTLSGNVHCVGVSHCQFHTYEEAKTFCNNNMACNGILQEAEFLSSEHSSGLSGDLPTADTKQNIMMRGMVAADVADPAIHPGCDGGFGCFLPASGELEYDPTWRSSQGKTFERQVLAYNRVQDGQTLSKMYQAGERNCPGMHFCQFDSLDHALAFCDHDGECLGVMRVPASKPGEGCQGRKDCYMPAKGELQHDPLWLSQLGETYLKQQEVAYSLRSDGLNYDGRFTTGTAGCSGVHNCQFQTLALAQAYCDANPMCRGILEHTPEANDEGNKGCAGGLGCFEPVKGRAKYDEKSLVVEAKLYERQLVR